MSKTEIISMQEAAQLVNDGDQIGFVSMGLAGNAEEVIKAIGYRYKQEQHPKDLSVIVASGVGNMQEGRGLDHFVPEGMTKRVIGGHILHSPLMNKKIVANEIEAYLYPQGTIAHLYRAIANGGPGVITKTGLQTYVDPRISGAKANDVTTEDLIEVIELDGEEWLNYKPFPIDVAIIRGTYADSKGNLSFEEEVAKLEALPLAQAAKASGGIVIAQVRGIVEDGSIDPKQVLVPGMFVDYVVVNEDQDYHYQTAGVKYKPELSNEIRVPVDAVPPLPFNERKIIGRRAAMEIPNYAITNLGVGIPDGISNIAAEEGVSNNISLFLELGAVGGNAQGGQSFGASINAEAMIAHQDMFDFIEGGGIDITVLGLSQADKHGNVNVAKFGPTVIGPGGFINISQHTQKLIFAGTMTRGAKMEFVDGKINIIEQGKGGKFLDEVELVCFSGDYSQETDQDVLYITERGVFDLHDGTLRLIEVAPGINYETDILPFMDFEPIISDDLKEMPAEIFYEEWGNWKNIIENK